MKVVVKLLFNVTRTAYFDCSTFVKIRVHSTHDAARALYHSRYISPRNYLTTIYILGFISVHHRVIHDIMLQWTTVERRVEVSFGTAQRV